MCLHAETCQGLHDGDAVTHDCTHDCEANLDNVW